MATPSNCILPMTAAAAKKKLRSEPEEVAEEIHKQDKGLWIDASRLPTAIAKRKHREENTRFLALADLVIGSGNNKTVIERRKQKSHFKGKERRRTRLD